MSQGSEELEGRTVVAGEPGTAYVELVACIVSATEETIGSKVRGGQNRGMNSRMKTLIRLRNQAGKAWRQALMSGSANTQEKWEVSKRRLAGVAAELSKDARRKRMKWRIKSLEHKSCSSRTIWRDLRSKGGKVEICALKTGAGITVVNPVEIREEIGRYMSELGRVVWRQMVMEMRPKNRLGTEI